MAETAAPAPAPDAAGRVLEAVRETGLLEARGSVVVLVSGGRDSVCLLDIAVLIAGPDAVCALHVDYGLRDDSGGDADFCEELCRRLGVGLRVERPGERPAGNLQAWARDVRYAAAAQLAIERQALVAVGHTFSDQAETVLYRLAASPGRRALLGMAPRDGRLVRPLLGVTREDTAAYCAGRGLAWRDDPSNDTPAYARNRVRSEVIPVLRDLHPGAEANIVRSAELLRDESAVLDELVAQTLGGAREVALSTLEALTPALRRLVSRRLAEDAVGHLAPAAAERVEEIVALGRRSAGESASLDLADGVRAVVGRGVLRFVETPPIGPARHEPSV